jgi:SAM-dependent methyltransferase
VADVPTDHRWDDAAYVAEWVATTPQLPHRTPILDALSSALPDDARRVVELGAGPGFLAEHLLAQHRAIDEYVLVDVSQPMHDLARERLAHEAVRVRHVDADFRTPQWVDAVPHAVDAVVTLQAVHELRHASRIPALYEQVHSILRPGGTFLVADLVNERAGERAHYLTTFEHLCVLLDAGFFDVDCVLDLGPIACVEALRAPGAAQ